MCKIFLNLENIREKLRWEQRPKTETGKRKKFGTAAHQPHQDPEARQDPDLLRTRVDKQSPGLLAPQVMDGDRGRVCSFK